MFSLLISISFLSIVYSGWIDDDTHEHHFKTKSLMNNEDFNLVFSDEFEAQGRQFKDGSDPKWTSINKDDYTNDALQYYKDELVTTNKGYLNISTINEDINYFAQDSDPSKGIKKMTKNYQSGMIQGWNKFCFTGGIVEISAKLPGKSEIGGLWPAMWLLGNLVRATYVSSSDNVWPWSYDKCSRDLQKQQEISACNVVNHFDLKTKTGRGAPEIDILEAMPGKEILHNTPINRPYFSASLQTSPGINTLHAMCSHSDFDWRPMTGLPPPHPDRWYREGVTYGENTSLNIYFYGTHLENTKVPSKSYQTDAISANHQLSDDHFDRFHKYRLEWSTGEEGYLRWYLDDEFLYGITAETLSSLTGSQIPSEPMYLIFNTAMSKTWGFPSPCPEGCPCSCFDCRKSECLCGTPSHMCDNFPAEFLIDYVRVYQSTSISSQKVGCSTPERPTSKYIQGYSSRYKQESDDEPLKVVQSGGGSCKGSEQCNIHIGVESARIIPSGTCVKGQCSCYRNYTGPHCLVRKAFDDIIWEPNEVVWYKNMHKFYFPLSWKVFCVVICVLFFGSVIFKVQNDRKKLKRRGYERISG